MAERIINCLVPVRVQADHFTPQQAAAALNTVINIGLQALGALVDSGELTDDEEKANELGGIDFPQVSSEEAQVAEDP